MSRGREAGRPEAHGGWQPPRPMPEENITCIDCGGVAHLLTTWPHDDPPQPGDIVTYRCSDCMDRWDLELPEMDR